MSLLARLFQKAVTDSRKWLQSSTRVISGDTQRPLFSNGQAVSHYGSWIYAAANLNAYAVASQPLRLYVRNRSAGTKLWNTRRTDRRTKAYLSGSLDQLPSRYAMTKAAEYGDDYEVITENHPVLDLLSKANPWENGFEQTVLRVLYLELTGNAYLHAVLDKRLGVPVELWTMPSQWVEVVPGTEKVIDGYLYGVSYEKRAFFPSDEVIHFKRPNPKDIYYGMGKVEAAWWATTNNQSLHDMDYHWFANKARPDWLLTIKGDASPDEIERLEAQIDSKLRGTRRTGRFLTATADIDIKPLSFSPKDMMGREQIVEEIAAVFGVPVSMLKANDPNLASATVGFASWKATSVLPLMRMDEEVLNQTLLPMFGIEEDAFLAYDNPVASDEKFETEKRRAYVAGGILTANEVREMEGLEAVSDPAASRLLINGQPLGGQPAQPSASPFAGLFGASAQPRQDAALTFGTATDTKPEPLAPKAVEAKETKAAERKDALGDCVESKSCGCHACTKDCGTGAGGFQPGNTCAGDDGSGGTSGANRSATAIASSAVSKAEKISITTGMDRDSFFDAQEAVFDVVNDIEKQWAAFSDQGKVAGSRFNRATTGSAYMDLVADNGRSLRVRVSDHQSAYGTRGEADEMISVSPQELSPAKAARAIVRFYDENRGSEDDGFVYADGNQKSNKSCGCGCASRKSVRQSEFVGKHATDFGAWLMTKSAEREAEKIAKSEAEAAAKVSIVFDAQVKELLEKLASTERPTPQLIADAERIIRSRGYQRAIVEALAPYLREAIATGAEIGIDTVSKIATEVDFSIERRDLAAYADTESIRLSRQTAAGVVETQSVRVREVLGSGLESGETTEQLASRVQEWADSQKDQDGSWSRATTIARTESMRAARVAEVEAWSATGMVEGKTWLLAPDPCEFCEAVAKQFNDKSVPLGDAFLTKDSTLTGADGGTMVLDYEDIQGAPLHPNCRCSLQPVLRADLEEIYSGMEADIEEEARKINLAEGNT
jgi:HK97 family phage portal protein